MKLRKQYDIMWVEVRIRLIQRYTERIRRMNKHICTVSSKQLFSSCLLASIAHAIMTNEYPDLSYEQSWDGDNYSKISENYRMMVSFKDDYCVGVIRNDEFRGFSQQTIHALLQESDFPTEAVDLLKAEALEYVLLEDEDGVAVPVVTSLLYGNAESLTVISNDGETLKGDMEALAPHIAPVERQIEYWREYGDMSDSQIALLKDLHTVKLKEFHTAIHMSDEQKKMLSGEEIDEECVTSFAEINIVV